MKPYFSYREENRPRTGIYASDVGQLGINVILALKGVEETDPMKWHDYLRMAAGKAVELQMCKVLKQNGVIAEDFDQESAPSTRIERHGTPISMRFDAVGKPGGATIKAQDLELPNAGEISVGEGEPIEIKSINNKNSFDIQSYIQGNPRENYVMQLSIYMDALGKDRGHLFCSTIDGLHTFWFVCERIGDGKYKCGNTVVDIEKEYQRFAKIWADKDKPLDELTEYWNEELYKVPIETIDWTKISTTKISDARNGRLVIGTEGKYKIDYSRWKSLIVERQGVALGYSPEELEAVKAATAGYSSKKKA